MPLSEVAAWIASAGLRLLQVARVETLSKPPENRSEQFTRLLHLALVTPETRKGSRTARNSGFGKIGPQVFVPATISAVKGVKEGSGFMGLA